MGAKNSKARKKGVAGEDESQDAVDKTATLPASFKQKEVEVSKTESLPRNLSRSTSFTNSCRNWAKKKGLVKDKSPEKKAETDTSNDNDAKTNGTAEPKIELTPAVAKLHQKKARAQFFEDMYNSSGISVTSSATPEKPKRQLGEINLPSPRFGPGSPVVEEVVESKVEQLVERIEEREKLNLSLDSTNTASLNRSMEVEEQHVKIDHFEEKEVMINRSIEVTEEAKFATMEMTGTTILRPPTPEEEPIMERNLEEEEEAARVCPVRAELPDQMQAQEAVKDIEEEARNMQEERDAERVCPELSLKSDDEDEMEEQPSTVEDAKESLAAMDEDEVKGLGKVQDILEGSVEHDCALDETLPSNARLETVAPSATEEEETKEKVEEVGEVNEVSDIEPTTMEPSSLDSLVADVTGENAKAEENGAGEAEENEKHVIDTGDSCDEGGASTDEGYDDEKKGGAKGLRGVLNDGDEEVDEDDLSTSAKD